MYVGLKVGGIYKEHHHWQRFISPIPSIFVDHCDQRWGEVGGKIPSKQLETGGVGEHAQVRMEIVV